MPNKGSQLLITQTVEFSAAHRLARADYSDEENRRVFGLCANPYGHGHNYKLEVCFSGTPDPETGMIVHFDRIKSLLRQLVVEPLDHRHLNHDVPFMEGILPTSENLLLTLWTRISQAIAGEPYRLHRLSLSSSERHRVDYYGENDV